MPDSAYKTFPAQFASRGIAARYTDDTLPQGTYLNLANVEELTENALLSRLGTMIINRAGNAVSALPASVHSLAKLASYAPNAWRYAGSGTQLYRRAGTSQGPYTLFASGMSGKPFKAGVYRPTMSSYPYLFIADAAKMLKDNGTSGTPQQWGIFQPNQPVQATAQPPQSIIVDEFDDSIADYALSNYTGASITSVVSTALTGAVTPGLRTVAVGAMTNINLFALLDINTGGGTQETVLVIAVQAGSFTAQFANNHAGGESVQSHCLSGSVAASTVATITHSGALNLGTFPNGVLSVGADYIGIQLQIDNPNNIQEIRVMLDVGDGSFTQNYFYKVIAPAVYQGSVSGTTTPAQSVYQQVASAAIGAFGNTPLGASPLLTGQNVWSPILIQLSQFQPVGQAGVNVPGFNFSNVTAFRIQITTNTNGGATVGMNDLLCLGGGGPDSFGGVSYDWLYTYYNNVTGAESNPCMFMANMTPATTTYITPRRQPVTLTLVPSTDPQVTNIRIYRRGGSLNATYLRVDTIAASATTYVDNIPDMNIAASTPVSLFNDVPVTSTLPVPVNTTLTSALSPTAGGQVMTIPVASMTGISVRQQVTLGNLNDPAQEIVIVQTVAGGSFTAFVQNPHLSGDPVAAQAVYGQPCNLMAVAYNSVFLAGDPNNPHFLYYSTRFSPESVGSPNYVEVGKPSDPITAIVPFQGSLYVATRERWYAIAPGQQGGAPTVYPTAAVHGVVATGGWVVADSEIWYQAMDGIRTFAGGMSQYRTQDIEFLFQNNGTTPVVKADPAQLQNTVMAYYNNVVYVAYMGMDGKMHRINYHTIYKRWRNDDVPATSLLLEEDTNVLLLGTSDGLVKQDRVGSVDETNNAGALVQSPISINTTTAYLDQGLPKNQKNYNELTVDADTQGQPVTVALLFDDGSVSLAIGTLQTNGRTKQNFNINAGKGQQAYRVALQLTASVAQRVTFHQVDLRGVDLAETRQSFDSYFLKFGTDESKICKQAYVEYNASQPVTFSLYYDQNPVAQYTFILPASTARISTRVRFPAIKFRLFRMIATSPADFQMWPDSKFEIKPVCSTKGYQVMNMMP